MPLNPDKHLLLIFNLISLAFSFPVANGYSQVITTFAGNGSSGSGGNGGLATSAQLFNPLAVCTDNSGNIYTADHNNHFIRKINNQNIISIVAGIGVPGYSGDNGPATAAEIMSPYGLCMDKQGNIFFSSDAVIRKINPLGVISTIAGIQGQHGHSGDGGPATQAKLNSPCHICLDKDGNLFIAEFGAQIIRKINTAGVISTFAGIPNQSGTPVQGALATQTTLRSPTGVAVDDGGNVYIADLGNSAIQKVDKSGVLTTFAGGKGQGYSGDGGPATNAFLNFPYAVHVDNNGNVFISDTQNGCVRMVDQNGVITTIAGNGTRAYSGDGGPPTAAQLMAPAGICFDNAGNMYITDSWANVIRKICALPVILQQPDSIEICPGADATLFIEANRYTTLQWQVSNAGSWSDLADNFTYRGTKSAKLRILSIQASMNASRYRCVVGNNCDAVKSGVSLLKVTDTVKPSLRISTSTNNICSGTNIAFTAVSNTPLPGAIYQWKKNGNNVGVNDSVYSDATLQSGDDIICTLIISDKCNGTRTVTSNSIDVSIVPASIPVISISASDNNICSQRPVTFTATTANRGTNPVYDWKKNGITVGNNSASYTDNNLSNNDVISCKLISVNECQSLVEAKSNEIVMKVITSITPVISIQSGRTNACPGEKVIFTATTSNVGLTPLFEWRKSNAIVGNNSSVYEESQLINGDTISCTIYVAGGCFSDSSATSNLVVVTIFKEPKILLDKANTICENNNRVLDAGNFKSYLWNDGSKQRMLSVSKPGKYYVTISDANGCVASDTSIITTILPEPKKFLPADTSICSYGSLLIKANAGYKFYLWSTNNKEQNLEITKPGSYVLTVTDYNNCTGVDTLLVSLKECMKGFFIPTAFTPNSDGKNDIFKPVLFGKVMKYQFSIFNRWGEKVFDSESPGSGWDGRAKSVDNTTNVFVWQCIFQLEGEPVESRKGTVILVR